MLSNQAIEAGHRLKLFQTIDSTSEEAFRQFAIGETAPLWIVAEEQSLGRGRSGRVWSSPPGNLYASLLLTDPLPMSERARVGFVAGLALVEALEVVAQTAGPFRLKWPNDVMAGTAKVSGLLLEARGNDGLVIGFGVNTLSAPEHSETTAVSLRSRGASVDPQRLFHELSHAFVGWWRVFDHGRGFDEIRKAWLTWSYGLNQRLRVRHGAGDRYGTFEGLDAEGRLVLREDDGQIFIMTAGDVFFPESSA
jgi:BirA family transcriptional regulator, biotin operon repressor / biotin---[acetyl-CoA-carboxylase] ligase